MGYEEALNLAVDAAREAAELLREEFHRPGGPRGERARARPMSKRSGSCAIG